MKKLGLFLGIVIVLAITSCRKDWTCKCTDDNSNTTYHIIPDASFSDADNTCNGFEYHNSFGYNNCSIVVQ